MLLVVVALFALAGIALHCWADYDRRVESARQSLREGANTLLHRLHRTLLGADFILRWVAAADRSPEAMTGPVASMDLRALARVIPGGRGIWIYDSTGTLVAPVNDEVVTPSPVPTEPFFADHKAGRESILGTSAASRGLLRLSRRLAGANGEFAGVAVALIHVENALEFGRTSPPATGQVTAIVHSDGTPLWRHGGPAPAQSLAATAMAAGTGTAMHLPVSIEVSIPASNVLSEWYRRVSEIAAILVLAGLLLGGLAFLALRALRSEERARDALGEANANLEWRVAERTAEALAQKRQAERANAAKTRLLDATSHDLRQPLQAARLFLDILLIKEQDSAQREIIQSAIEAIHAGGSILDALVDVATLDSGALRPRIAPVDVAVLLKDLAVAAEPAASEKRLVLRHVARREWVASDGELLRRILVNILDNAIRFTARGRILLGCRRVGYELRIEIWDTGLGIEGRDLNRIFEDFQQVANAERDRSQGLGLGLSVVVRLSRLLGHRVTVRSWPGCGSVFAVTVPITEAPASARVAA